MGSYSYKKHKKSKHGKKHRRHTRHTRHTRRTRHMEGGKVCTQSPYQFNQSGGGKKYRNGKGRHMKGGGFFDFGKLWNPSNPASGGNVIPLSSSGISPAGVGSPASTSTYRPNIQAWPAQNLIRPHEYAIGGRQTGGDGVGGGKHTRKLKGKGKGRGRGLRGGNILGDIQTFGRDIIHRMGSVVNGVSGYDNKLYNMNPNPTIQFPRGLGAVTTGGSTYNTLDLKTTYDRSYADASLK